MGVANKEDCLLALKAEWKKSLKLLALPEEALTQLEEIPEEENEQRIAFIERNFNHHLKNLKEFDHCIIPSILGPNNFVLAIRVGNQVEKLFGAIKDSHFELRFYDRELIKTRSLRECHERGVLFFEEQGLMPIIFESHRGLVEQSAGHVLDQALENNRLPKIQSLFLNLHIGEIDEEILFKAFEKSSKEIIEFFLNKILKHELRLRHKLSPKIEARETRKMFDRILHCARTRAARGDKDNLEIAALLRNFLEKQYSEYFTQTILTREKKRDSFYAAITEISKLNPAETHFKEKLALLEHTIIQTLKELKSMGDIPPHYINIRVGSTNEYPLDIALIKGSPRLIRHLIQQGASPTTGWKYETLENFRENRRSVLGYLLSRSPHRSDAEKQEIATLLEDTLSEIERERQAATAKKITQVFLR